MSETRPITVAFVTGEASGDRQGAALLAALRGLAAPRPVRAWGLGGAHLREAGCDVRMETTRWAGIGVVNVLASAPAFLVARFRIRRWLAADPPDALVLIDAGAFNVPLGRWARARGIPVFYHFPPGSWRKSLRKASVIEASDRIVTPFPWSERLLRDLGADARFVGHPLLDLVAPSLSADEFCARYGLDGKRPLVALLPGSRRGELTAILPAMLGAAAEIARRIPGVQFALALAETAPRALVEEAIRREQGRSGTGAKLTLLMHQAGGRIAQMAQTTLAPPPLVATNEGLTMPPPTEDDRPRPAARPAPADAPLVICEGIPYDVMARSDLVITKSGTATLEAAILGKPMIVVYRGSKWMELEWAVRKKYLNIAHIALPNILADERIVPELIQDAASPGAIAERAVEMLLQPEHLLKLKERLADLVRMNLGEPGGVRRAAALLLETIAQ